MFGRAKKDTARLKRLLKCDKFKNKIMKVYFFSNNHQTEIIILCVAFFQKKKDHHLKLKVNPPTNKLKSHEH